MLAKAWADKAPTRFRSARASARASNRAFSFSSSSVSDDFASDQATLEKARGPNSRPNDYAPSSTTHLRQEDRAGSQPRPPPSRPCLICWAVIFGTLRSRDADTADTSRSWAASQVAAAQSKLAQAWGPNSCNLVRCCSRHALRLTPPLLNLVEASARRTKPGSPNPGP